MNEAVALTREAAFAYQSYSYDTGGRLTTRTLGSVVTTSYAYDGANQVTNVTVSNGATNLWAESYAYNEAGRRISTTRGNGSASYQYDDTYQLTGANYGTGTNASSASWSYDASGNRSLEQSISGTNTLGISYSVNVINQYTSVGGASPSYNSRGDLSGINGWAFTYDAFGNLSAAQSGTNAAYHYARDPLGRRAIRQSGSNTILLLNAGDTMLEAYNASNNSATSYVYEPGIDRPLAQVLSSGAIRYVHQDALGSVVMLTDSNGAPYQSYSYDAWGKVTARDASGSVIASSAISAPWLFTGRRFDKESGLYHYRARTYSAELGRFLQMDPIKFDAGDPNIFRYVGNDPLNAIDPSGKCGEDIVKKLEKMLKKLAPLLEDIENAVPKGDERASAYDKLGSGQTDVEDVNNASNQDKQKLGPNGDAAKSWQHGSKVGGTSLNPKL